MLLQEKKALITGGGRGISKVIAAFYLREGAEVVIASKSEEELKNATEEFNRAHPGKISYFQADVSNPEDVKRLLAFTVKKLGSIDILVNGAGIYGPIGPSHEVDLDHWRKTYEVNVFGAFFMFHEVAPEMIKNGGGKIINFSGGGDGPLPRFSAYNSSKAAIVRLTETLAEEVKDYKIAINCIAPGPVNTAFLDEALSAGIEKLGSEKYKNLLKQKEDGGVPPEKAADLCVFLASSKSDGLSGKFLSAVWDNYWEWNETKIKEIMAGPSFTYRRVK